jgi:hypothetical protein
MDDNASATDLHSASAFQLGVDDWGRLVLTDAGGKRHVGVEPIRAFPISDPGKWISLCDAEGHEVAWIESLDELSEANRAILAEELAHREFVPVIQRIVSASSEVPSDWEVITDRGPTRFTLTSDDDVRRLGPHRAMILDARGTRYLIPDVRRLDSFSRRVVEHHF